MAGSKETDTKAMIDRKKDQFAEVEWSKYLFLFETPSIYPFTNSILLFSLLAPYLFFSCSKDFLLNFQLYSRLRIRTWPYNIIYNKLNRIPIKTSFLFLIANIDMYIWNNPSQFAPWTFAFLIRLIFFFVLYYSIENSLPDFYSPVQA